MRRVGPATPGTAMTTPPTGCPHRRATSVARTTSAGASVILSSVDKAVRVVPFAGAPRRVPDAGGLGRRGHGPGDDRVRAADRAAVVEFEHGDDVGPGELLGALAAGGLVEDVGQDPQAVRLHDLRSVTRFAQRCIRPPAGMT